MLHCMKACLQARLKHLLEREMLVFTSYDWTWVAGLRKLLTGKVLVA